MKFWMPLVGRKKPDESGPRFGDLYERGLASAIDIMLIFLALDGWFRMLSARIYAHVDQAKMALINQEQNISLVITHLWQIHAIQLWLLNFTLQVLCIGIFYVGCQWIYATTPGKWLLGLKIVHAKTLEPASRGRLLLRFFAYIPACAPLMVGILWMSFNHRRRGWHDAIAGTVVLNMRPRGWYWGQLKRGVRRLFAPSAVEQPVGKPAAEQRHEDGEKPVQ